jgi:hypothetical protein
VSGVGPAKEEHGSEACVVHGRYQHGQEIYSYVVHGRYQHGSEAVLYMVNQTKKNDTMKNDLKNNKAIAQLPAVDHLVKPP